MKRFFRTPKNKRGQTLVEYALIVAFISVVAIAALITVARIKGAYIRIESNLSSAQASH